MSGLRPRRKGVRVELAIAKLIGARKVSRAYQAGHDLELLLSDDRMLRIECKARADGFRQLYDWLDQRDVLIVKSDRREPLVVVRMSLAAELAKAGARRNSTLPRNAWAHWWAFGIQWPHLYSLGESRISAAPAGHAIDTTSGRDR
jgi:hypothetical protein